MRILSMASSYPRYEGDRYGLFIHELNKEIAKRDNDVAALVPLTYDFKNLDPQRNLAIYRFQYFFPSKLQRLTYGHGIFANVKTSMLAKLQLPFFLVAELLGAIRLVSREKIEIVHAHWIIPQGLIAVILKNLFDVPVIVTVHGTDLRECPGIIRRYILNNTDAIISPHPELREILVQEGYDVKEIKNLIGKSPIDEEEVLRLKNELNLNNMIVVTFIARLDEFKDPITFVQSVSHVLKQIQNVKFLLVGEGPLEGAVRDIVHVNSAGNVVKLMGKRDDIGNILSLSTIFVALSPIENIWSLTILEAMKYGVPCIVTNSGTTAKHLQHRIHAFLIEPKSETDLSNAIVELSHDITLRKQLVENSSHLLEKSGFSSNQIVNDVISIYYRCLK